MAVNSKCNPSNTNFSNHPHTFKFTAKLFEFLLGNAPNFCVKQSETPDIDNKMKSGFNNFFECLNMYMNHITSDESKVTIYRSFIIENGAIMCATNGYYGRP